MNKEREGGGKCTRTQEDRSKKNTGDLTDDKLLSSALALYLARIDKSTTSTCPALETKQPSIAFFVHHSHCCCCCWNFVVVKRFREPPEIRRSWEVWWYDTSKQGIGAIAIHLANVYLSPLFQGDPCTWYVINFLLDSTIGLLIVFIGIRLCQFLASYKKWPAINFGVYGKGLFKLEFKLQSTEYGKEM